MEKNDTLSTIDYFCKKMNWSLYKLSINSGISYASLKSMYAKNSEPKISTLCKICYSMNISLLEFFDAFPQNVILFDEAINDTIELYRRLPSNKQMLATTYIKKLVEEELRSL